ncbi:MAG TPA: hypothetical protein DCR43_03505 [Bacteroidales bacterium]|nr:MAG: hypothetical protein A2X11_00255 [Bacteroidetes bacterium GWE2_42_24]OFY27767.1 MAG: hypothetical protein A2X09_02645 [Bacteroidetes bacterium GWF2_43_11]HAQ64909.1 hypothetical protein [Bacteroidales bacterium]HBZ66125.1 hypothetical protein [Bacteroidales bacterium]
MAIITLTSDWGTRDHYLPAVKGALLSRMPDAVIVDISHEIEPFDLNQASFVLRNCYHLFPKGTVHIVAINTEADLENPHIAIRHNGHYFIGTDNGLFSLMFDTIPEEIFEIDIPQDSDYFTFPTRDVFVKAAVHLAKGGAMEELGDPLLKLFERMAFRPVISGDAIIGKVIYTDRYENVFTNITEGLFKSECRNRSFNIEFSVSRYRIRKINKSYGDVPEGELVALFSTTGNLEIAINKGNAASLLGLGTDDAIRIQFG